MEESIKTRRSTRKYSERAVEPEKLEQVIEAGRCAPSGGNSQTTHFIVVKNRAVLERLTELVQTAFAAMEETPGMYSSMVSSIRASRKGGYVFHYNPYALIITANRRDYGNNLADCACALENMMIEANAQDLGSCWINQLKWLNEEPTLVEYLRSLGMAENERVYGALALGYADTPDGLPNRQPLKRTGNPVTVIE